LSSSPTDRLGGYWGGERRDKPNAGPRTAIRLASTCHIVTIDETLLAEIGLPKRAPLCLFETTDVAGRKYRHVDPAPAFAAIACTVRAALCDASALPSAARGSLSLSLSLSTVAPESRHG
jgi:hypothetical protein